MTDNRIADSVELSAPRSRVWRALTDYREFGQWFRVVLDTPFVVGQRAHGHIAYPGYEHLLFEAQVTAMEPESRFVFTWHPYPIDPAKDYSNEPSTVVEFLLDTVGGGTRLSVSETGFDAIPAERRDEAFEANREGWAGQMKNIEAYLRDSQ